MRQLPNEIHPRENIGRGLFSSSHFSSKKGKVQPEAFLHPGHSSLSVDRLDYAQPGELKIIGWRSAKMRGPNRRFHGWAKLTAEQASKNGRTVMADPVPRINPFHARIELSAQASNDFKREEEANDLAYLSRYVSADWVSPSPP